MPCNHCLLCRLICTLCCTSCIGDLQKYPNFSFLFMVSWKVSDQSHIIKWCDNKKHTIIPRCINVPHCVYTNDLNSFLNMAEFITPRHNMHEHMLALTYSAVMHPLPWMYFGCIHADPCMSALVSDHK